MADGFDVSLVISVSSLVLSLVNSLLLLMQYRKDKPIVEVDSVKCTHRVADSIVRRTDLDVGFYVRNVGNYSTKLTELRLKSVGNDLVNEKVTIDKTLEGHLGYDLTYVFKIGSRISEPTMRMSLELVHTHGIKNIEATSKLL